MPHTLWVGIKLPCIVVLVPPEPGDTACDGPGAHEERLLVDAAETVSPAGPAPETPAEVHRSLRAVVLPCANASPMLLAVRDRGGALCVLSGGDTSPPPRAVNSVPFSSDKPAFSSLGLEAGTLQLWEGSVGCDA